MVYQQFTVEQSQTALFSIEFIISFNIALRELPNSEDVTTSKVPSAVAGLPNFLDTVEVASEPDWDLFMVATNAIYSISVNEILRDVTEPNPRIPALINNLNEQAAERKVVSVIFLSLAAAGRKSLTDKFPQSYHIPTGNEKSANKLSRNYEIEHWKDIASPESKRRTKR